MSQAGSFISASVAGSVSSLTGNTGGAVGPDGSSNINVIGSGVITVTGSAGTNTLTSTLVNGTNGQVLIGGGAAPLWATMTSTGGTVTFTLGANTINLEATSAGVSSFVTNAGTATGAGNSISILGGSNISTTGVGAVVTASLNSSLTGILNITMQDNGAMRTGTTVGDKINLQAFDTDGVAYMSFAQLVAGTTPSMDLADAVTKNGQYIYRQAGIDVLVADGGTGLSTAPTNGQLLIGNAGAYAVANLASSGSTVVITNGAGTINLEVGATTATTFTADGGTANPAANNITMAGGTNITTSATGSTVTTNLDAVLAGLTSATFNTGGAIRTSTALTNTLFLQAFDVDGASYTTFATLTANNVPTMNLSDAVTKANQYIYRQAGTDVLITDGGTGTSSAPTNGQLLIGNSGAYAVAALASSGATITITNGAGTINLESVNQNGATTFSTDAANATVSTNAITIAGGLNLSTSGTGSTVTVAMDASLTGIISIAVDNGGAFRTNTIAGNTAILQAFDVDGGLYTTFAFLTANNTPTMDLTDAVTKAGQYIYRVAGNDVSVSDGGTGVSTLTAFAVLCGGTTSTSPVQSVASVGTAGQILTSNGAGALPTFQAPTSFAWTEITGTSITTVANNGYILNNASLVTATIPATCAVGDIIAIVGKGIAGWRLAQNSGQSVHMGAADTTTGTGGSLQATNRRDSIEIICTTANTEFTVRSSMGNLTVV